MMLPRASTVSLSPEAARVIARMARPVPARTSFVEVRFTHVLDRPLVLRGELEYGGQARLGKRIDAPFHERTTIRDGMVEIDRQGREPRRFQLSRVPELRALLGGFSALLGGHPDALAEHYRVSLAQKPPNWTLQLAPLDADLAAHLRNMRIDGRDDSPRCFTLNEADGDTSVMLLGTLSARKFQRPPTRMALKRLCQRGP